MAIHHPLDQQVLEGIQLFDCNKIQERGTTCYWLLTLQSHLLSISIDVMSSHVLKTTLRGIQDR